MLERDRYTVRGGAAVEAQVRELLGEARAVLARALPAGAYRAVVLMGGYGRGEGGVETVGALEHLHNNVDLLVVSRSRRAASALKSTADRVLGPVADRHGIGIDVGVVSERALKTGPCLVMWYDMRFGHETLLGDTSFVPALARFTLGHVVPSDVRNLLVNRGTLLVINELLLGAEHSAPRCTGQSSEAISEARRRAVVKHIVKAIIGYGDALLFFLGDYHWSYVEKRRRMRRAAAVSRAFRALYDQAMELRFSPRYAECLSRDLSQWNSDTLAALESVHLECERRRLRDAALCWDSYLEAAFSHALFDMRPSFRAAARSVVELARSTATTPPSGWRARLGCRVLGPRGRLPIIFPVVAYDLPVPRSRHIAASMLAAPTPDHADLRLAYLQAWSTHGDANFGVALRRLGMSI